MIGAIIGDIAGSRFEFNNIHTKEFELMNHECFATDDSIMTLAVAWAVLQTPRGDFELLGRNAVRYMQEIGRPYPDSGYGGRFYSWMYSDDPQPYNSFGNGAAMRVSACAYVAQNIEEVKKYSKAITEVTHNHPEGIKGAEATAVSVFLAGHGSTIDEIREYVRKNYYPDDFTPDFTLDNIRETYAFNEICQQTVPQAIEAFLESESFEDTIRNAISIGGDSDTIAAIAGSIAEAYYGVPDDLRKKAVTFLDGRLLGILNEFEEIYPPFPGKQNKCNCYEYK